MQLSLRTLLAFEDNVFDVEQHRRLEQLLPTDKNAETTLRRIRSIMRNPSLGVPGLVDQQEELDPNYVAEYLDHQMSGSVQEKFETYCLSADKYLAEIASIHHILSNVLGEPARTSRECRHKCYDVVLEKPTLPPFVPAKSPTHFHPEDTPQTPNTVKTTKNRYFTSLWNRLFPSKPVPVTPAAPAEKRPPLWTFTILGTLLGIFICVLLFAGQLLDRQRLDQQSRTVTTLPLTENIADELFSVEHSVPEYVVAEHEVIESEIAGYIAEANDIFLNANPQIDVAPSWELTPSESSPSFEVITQTAFTPEPFTVAPAEEVIAETSEVVPTESEPDRFTSIQRRAMPTVEATNPTAADDTDNAISDVSPVVSTAATIITFQQQSFSSPKSAPEYATVHPNGQPPLSVLSRQSTGPAAGFSITNPVSVTGSRQLSPNPQPITQMSATVAVPKVLGRAVQTSLSDVIFSASSSGAPWRLPSLPFDLIGDQYLLTAAPFRGTFELAARFQIEMVGDAKLCILPLDASGTPGIFVDYGRIIIRPLQPNQTLRIETEKARGMISASGTDSILFIDTFADISESSNGTRSPEEQKAMTGPILGVVPKNGERIAWQTANQPQPFYINALGSVLLQSERYRLGEIRYLPSWIQTVPLPPENRALADVCRRYFAETQIYGDWAGERALIRLIQDESLAVRALGYRLWGDLGRFDVPIAAVAERRQGEEEIRRVLNQYFNEVMRRDEESVQRFAEDLEEIKAAQKN